MKGLEHNKRDLIVVDNINKKWSIVDFSVNWDANVKTNEDDKIRFFLFESKTQFP